MRHRKKITPELENQRKIFYCAKCKRAQNETTHLCDKLHNVYIVFRGERDFYR